MKLSSAQNPRVKAAQALSERKERRATGLFAVEGAREIERARRGGFVLVELFHCPDAATPAAAALVAAVLTESASSSPAPHSGASGSSTRSPAAALYEITPEVFAKLAVREGSDGLYAVFRQREPSLAGLSLGPNSLVLAIQGIEKPGNLGALLRSADGAGADAVVVLDRALDLYNPNVIRASLGTVFSLPVAAASSLELRELARAHGLKLVAAALSERSVEHFAADLRGPIVLVLGEEAQGLTPDWLAEADICVKIPMRGIADSLNVGAAGAVLLYEALRQRAASTQT